MNKRLVYGFITSLLTISAIMIIKSTEVSGNNQIEGESNSAVYESEICDHNIVTLPANASDVPAIALETPKHATKFNRGLSEEEKYLLAKIAMAEAEGESFETKILVILTVLNRVDSENRYFPDTIKEVIFQERKGVYQFTPVIPGGRWWKVEPNKECWKAVEMVNEMKEDISNGALYFEACINDDNWHSRNLEFICQSSNTRFYK